MSTRVTIWRSLLTRKSAAGRGQDAQTPITKKKDRVFESNSPQKLQHSAGVETPSNPKHPSKIERLKTESKLSKADHEAQKTSTTLGGTFPSKNRNIRSEFRHQKLSEAAHEAQKTSTTPRGSNFADQTRLHRKNFDIGRQETGNESISPTFWA